ncbi:hypothetical protein ES707_02322 [subsurface metagenome]
MRILGKFSYHSVQLWRLLFRNPPYLHCPANYRRANQILDAEEDKAQVSTKK